MYFQFAFALNRVNALAPQHPEWKDQEPFKSVLAGDLKGVFAAGEPAIVQLMMASHAGMTTTEFEQIVKDWIAAAKHPRFNRPYTDCVYQPMVELLAYMRANGFKTYIVCGGGIEFMRPWTEQVYGIPPEQVVGSTIKTKFEMRDGKPVLMRLPEVDFVDDRLASQSAFTNSSAGGRFSPSATSMAITRCCSGRPRAAGHASWASSTTPMPSANGPMTVARRSESSTRRSMRRWPRARLS
jgi:haloacid dehalogenase-like hydrolase